MNHDQVLTQSLALAKRAAIAGGRVLRQKYKKIKVIADKAKDIQDFVTEADWESEKAILSRIRRQFPRHGILAEESGKQGNLKSGYLWLVDPLCGTANFVNQLDLFVISIALVYQGQPMMGVIYHPLSRTLFSAITGQGARVNGRQIQVSKTRKLDRSVVAVTFGKTQEDRQSWAKPISRLVTKAYKIREFGSTPFSCSLVADGRIDAFMGRPEPWDVVSGIVLVQEAGGKVTDWQGRPWSFESDSLVASNGKNHRQIINLLS